MRSSSHRAADARRRALTAICRLNEPFVTAQAFEVAEVATGGTFSYSKVVQLLWSLRADGTLNALSPQWSKPVVLWWHGEEVPTSFIPPERWIPDEHSLRVYYARETNGDLIKIGYSAQVRKRLWSLRCELLAVEPGGRELEQQRHQQFSASRVSPRQEWFRPTPDLLAHIDALAGLA